MTVKIIVCRVGDDPKIEEVENPFAFTRDSLLGGGYIEAKLVEVQDTRVVYYWDEDARMKRLKFNRNVPARAKHHGQYNFVVDARSHDHPYAKPGEMGFFPILGNFCVTKADNNGDHISLNDYELGLLTKLLELHRCEHCKKNVVAYPEARFCGSACTAMHEMKMEAT